MHKDIYGTCSLFLSDPERPILTVTDAEEMEAAFRGRPNHGIHADAHVGGVTVKNGGGLDHHLVAGQTIGVLFCGLTGCPKGIGMVVPAEAGRQPGTGRTGVQMDVQFFPVVGFVVMEGVEDGNCRIPIPDLAA